MWNRLVYKQVHFATVIRRCFLKLHAYFQSLVRGRVYSRTDLQSLLSLLLLWGFSNCHTQVYSSQVWLYHQRFCRNIPGTFIFIFNKCWDFSATDLSCWPNTVQKWKRNPVMDRDFSWNEAKAARAVNARNTGKTHWIATASWKFTNLTFLF